MSSVPVGYPNEVWVAIKALWESVPKISLTDLRNQVGETMGCSMPTESVIARKIKDKKWKKIIRKTDRVTVKSSVKTPVTPDGENDGDMTGASQSVTMGEDGSIDGEFKDISSEFPSHNYPLDPTRVFSDAKRVLSGVEKTIKNHRQRNATLGTMQDTLVDQYEDVLDVKLDTANKNFESEAKKLVTALRVLQLKTGVLTDLAIANKAIQSSDRESWGIESSGDDSTNELRKVDSTILDKKLNENRAALTKQKEVYVQEKMKRIESGEIFNQQEAV